MHGVTVKSFSFARITSCIARRLHRRAALVLGVLLSVLLASPAAFAQGTSDTLPNPISVSEFDRYCDRLGLSDQQKIAAEGMHDAYLNEFRALREGPIERFMEDMREMQGASGMSMPERDRLEAFLKDMNRMRGRIRSLDSRFFDQVQTILSAEQMHLIQRVRLLRQRERFNNLQQLGPIGAGLAPDIADMVLRQLTLSESEFEIVDPLLAEYESKLTKGYHEMYSTVTGMYLEMYDALEAIGFDEEAMTDPKRAQEMMGAMQSVFAEILGGVRGVSQDMKELNKRTFRSVQPLLSPTNQDLLFEVYYSESYPRLASMIAGGGTMYHAALKLEDLTDDQRTILADELPGLRATRDQLVVGYADLLDEQQRTMDPFSPGRSDEAQALGEKLQEMQRKLVESGTYAQELLTTTLTPEQYQSVMQIRMASLSRDSAAATGNVLQRVSTGPSSESSPLVTFTYGPDMFLPAQITKADVAEWTRMLGSDEATKLIIDSLFEEYNTRYVALNEGPIADVQHATGSVWNWNTETNETTHGGMEAVEEVYSARTTALAAILSLENEFFDRLSAAVDSEALGNTLEHIRLARLRTVYNRGDTQQIYAQLGAGLESFEADLDLRILIKSLRLDDETLADLDQQLLAYERQLTDLFRQKYLSRVDVERAQDRWTERVTRLQAEATEEDRFAAISADYLTESRKIMEDPENRHSAVREQIALLNRATMDELASSFSRSMEDSFRRAYLKATFPGIYNDSMYATPYLRAAIALTDLDNAARDRIDAMLVEYEPEYDRLSSAMVGIAREGFNYGISFDPKRLQELQRRRDRLDRERFSRSQLSERTLRRLRQLLTVEQIEALQIPSSNS